MTLPRNVDDAYPLSPMQRLMLLHAISSAGNGVLLNQVCYDVRGALDAGAFHRAWDALVARHPALRTAFLWQGLPQPLQVVRTVVGLPFRHVDLTDVPAATRAETIDALRREDADAPMTLGKAPLMRCTLVRLAADRHHFIWTVHHLVVDRWSHAVLFADLRALYGAHVAGAEPALGQAATFRDYIAWIARQDHVAAERFWRGEMSGVREPTLLAPQGTAALTGRRLTTRRVVPRDVTSEVRERAAAWRTTPATIVLAAVALVASSRTRRDDVMCGITVAGRPPELHGAETIVGSFVNNLPARLTVERGRSVGDWVRDLQRGQARRQAFAHVALTDIHAWSEVPPARPLFDTLVLLNLTDESDVPWPGIELHADSATLDAAYPLLLSVTVEDDHLVFTLVHDSNVHDADGLLPDLEAAIARLTAADRTTLVGELVPAPTATVGGSIGAGAAVSATRHAVATNGASTADALLGAWRDVLGIESLGLDDDFFALGGSSLQAAQLFTRVERITGKTLPLSTLFSGGSVRALLAAIDHPVPRSGTLVGMRSSGTQPPLYAIPGIGGNVVGLAGLARALGPDQPFFAFESPGLDGRETPLTSIDAIAERYARDMMREETRPVHLLGLCWGAAVVVEIARKLTALGRAPMSLALINPTSLLRVTAPRSRLETARFLRSRLELYWDEFREGDWGDRTRLVASKARRAAKVLAGGHERRHSQGEINQFRVIEANKEAVIRYVPAPLDVRARIFITPYREDGDDPRLEWLSLIEPRPDVVPVSGVNAGDAIAPANVGAFAEALREWLRAAPDRMSSAR
jgi:thioesterase domain-containing protein